MKHQLRYHGQRIALGALMIFVPLAIIWLVVQVAIALGSLFSFDPKWIALAVVMLLTLYVIGDFVMVVMQPDESPSRRPRPNTKPPERLAPPPRRH